LSDDDGEGVRFGVRGMDSTGISGDGESVWVRKPIRGGVRDFDEPKDI